MNKEDTGMIQDETEKKYILEVATRESDGSSEYKPIREGGIIFLPSGKNIPEGITISIRNISDKYSFEVKGVEGILWINSGSVSSFKKKGGNGTACYTIEPEGFKFFTCLNYAWWNAEIVLSFPNFNKLDNLYMDTFLGEATSALEEHETNED